MPGTTDGGSPNGIRSNGASPKGAGFNGIKFTGISPNGISSNGSGHNGSAHNGVGPNGVGPNSVSPDGTGHTAAPGEPGHGEPRTGAGPGEAGSNETDGKGTDGHGAAGHGSDDNETRGHEDGDQPTASQPTGGEAGSSGAASVEDGIEDEAEQVPADVQAAFTEWARAWHVWSARARADADRRHLHTTLYGVAQRLAQEGDTLELVLATGLLTWWLPRPVRRHLLVTRLVVEVDPMTSAVRLRVPGGTSTRLEDSAFLDGVPAFRPERTNALHERLRSRDAAPLGADDERLLRDWLTLAVDGTTAGYRPGWPPPGPAGPSAAVTLAPALVLRSRGHAALLNYYEQMLDALRGDGRPPLGLAQLVETLDTSERLAWLASRDGPDPGPGAGPGPRAITAAPGERGAGRHREPAESGRPAEAEEWLSPLPISPEQARVMRRLRMDNGVVVEGPPGTGKTHTIANLISALLAEGRRVLVTSQKGQALRVLQEKLPPELRRLCVSLTDSAESGAGELATSVSALAAQKAVYDAGSQDERIRTARSRRDSAVAERDRISTAVAARRAAEWRRHGTYEVGPGWSGTRAEIAARLRDEAAEHGWIPVPVPGPEGGGWPRPPITDAEAAELWQLLTAPDATPPGRAAADAASSRQGGFAGFGDTSAAPPTSPLVLGPAARLAPPGQRTPLGQTVQPGRTEQSNRVTQSGETARPSRAGQPGETARPGQAVDGASETAGGPGAPHGSATAGGESTPAEEPTPADGSRPANGSGRADRSGQAEGFGPAGGSTGLLGSGGGPSDPPTVPSPITSALALSALREQRAFGLPPELGELPTRSELSVLAHIERVALTAAKAAEDALSRQAVLMAPVIADALARAGDEAAERMAAGADDVRRALDAVGRRAVRQQWVADALADAFAGRAAVLWTKVAAAAPAIAEASQAVVELGLHRVELPTGGEGPGRDLTGLLSSALALREHMEAGGSLRRLFRSKAQKDAGLLLDGTTVDGVTPRSPELLDLALCRLRAEVALEAATRAWSLLGVAPDPAVELEVRLARLTEAQDAARAIDVAVAARDRLAALLDALGVETITLDSPTSCADVGAAVNAHRLRQSATVAGTQLRDLTADLVAAAGQPDAVPELALLAIAVEARDPAEYVAALEATAGALNGRARARRRAELLGRVREAHPLLADLLALGNLTAGNPNPEWGGHGSAAGGAGGWNSPNGFAAGAFSAGGFAASGFGTAGSGTGGFGAGGFGMTGVGPERMESFGRAWSHAVAATWLARVRAVDQTDLDADLDAADELVASATAELAGALAWKHCLERMGTEQSAALRAYADAMAAGGRFTGRHAERYRQAAREAMRIAQTAVPAWVMPISEVLSTIPAVRDSFDVVIVDEGSQAGLDSLFLLWLAPRVIVVGDDRQCTPPDASVEELEPVFTRLDTLLPDIPSWLRVGFTPRSSLFSLLRTRFGDVVRLREHFRCMPEIIEWSSAMFYRDAPLVPLRQFGADRLAPLRAQFVPHAYTTSTPAGPRNPIEAEALVTQVLNCAEDPRYRGLSFGIVVLQGTAQAELIRSELSARMSAAEQLRRHLRVGSPPDFQGDERDVVFLSLVIAPGTSTTSLTRLEYQRRFNVAASRARDQVWLFHSVSTADLDPGDLRHSYLSYVLAHSVSAPMAIMATPLSPSEVSPVLPHPRFDSLFEQRVFLALSSRGYHVTPQVEINGRRFDLVVSGGRARLAVECDGDATRSTEDVERDLTRERELRRVGWRIWRVRRSEFEIDPEAALAPLWPRLAAAGIAPTIPVALAPPVSDQPDPAMLVTQLLAAPAYASPVPPAPAAPAAAPASVPPSASVPPPAPASPATFGPGSGPTPQSDPSATGFHGYARSTATPAEPSGRDAGSSGTAQPGGGIGAGTGTAGLGEAGIGATGPGSGGTGNADRGNTDVGDAGLSVLGLGVVGRGTHGSGLAGPGITGHGATDPDLAPGAAGASWDPRTDSALPSTAPPAPAGSTSPSGPIAAPGPSGSPGANGAPLLSGTPGSGQAAAAAASEPQTPGSRPAGGPTPSTQTPATPPANAATPNSATAGWPTSGGSPTGWASVGTAPNGFPGVPHIYPGPDSWPGVSLSPNAPSLPGDAASPGGRTPSSSPQAGGPARPSAPEPLDDLTRIDWAATPGGSAPPNAMPSPTGSMPPGGTTAPGGTPTPGDTTSSSRSMPPSGTTAAGGTGAAAGAFGPVAPDGAAGLPNVPQNGMMAGSFPPVGGVPSVHSDPDERRQRWRPIPLSDQEGLDDA
ncbi:Superfamily I DNA and RNA helicase and helicase subunits-like protein [Parafrankia sp. Ea1.12]|uniref:AAA domain-containing protein n=1 Tax=Parafrankia sp. Ea1.12 TaxID=573499 RepID=UPI000DA4581F|nr:AAA domain-containing protein [Parafrankia sp. Ea1.12]SQD99796.1 Superfamily I DNA and RNA helicase and helicase subunits-like protein [Parafrankia sp. Ea1.12]